MAALQRQIERVQRDRERMLVELEREEEFLTNTLQKKLVAARQEKANVESEVLKLKAQLTKMMQEREATAKRVEEEEEYITNTLSKKLETVLHQKQALEMMLSRDESRSSSRSNSVVDAEADSPAGSNPGSKRDSGRLPLSRSNSSRTTYKFL